MAELVRLKDGPRDAAYELAKPLAWREARAALEPALPWEELIDLMRVIVRARTGQRIGKTKRS